MAEPSAVSNANLFAAMRPGRGRAPGLARALGNRVYRTDPLSGNLELANDALEPGQSEDLGPSTGSSTRTPSVSRESTSPLSNVFAFDIPQPRKPSLGRTLGGAAGSALAGAGIRKAGSVITDAIRRRGFAAEIPAGTAGKAIPGFGTKDTGFTAAADDLRAEALRDAGIIDAEGFDTGPALQEGVDVIGAADLGDAGAIAEPTKGFADFGADWDFGGGARDVATAAGGSIADAVDFSTLASDVGGDAAEGAADALADATGGVPVIGPAISLAQGDVEGAAGSAAGGAIGGAVGGPPGAVIGSVVGGYLVRDDGMEFVNQVVDDTGHIIGEVAADGVSVVNHAGDVIGKAAGGLARSVGDVVGGIGSFVKDIPIIGNFFGGGGGCYLTEAVAAGGGADNAPELETLRWFRDNVLVRTPEGQELIAEYEQAAPAIVQAIMQRPDAQQVLQHAHDAYILPAVEAVRTGRADEALRIYAEMNAYMASLAQEVEQIDPATEQLLEEFAQEAAEVSHDGEMASAATATGNELVHPGDQMMQRPMPHQPMSRLGRIYAGS